MRKGDEVIVVDGDNRKCEKHIVKGVGDVFAVFKCRQKSFKDLVVKAGPECYECWRCYDNK